MRERRLSIYQLVLNLAIIAIGVWGFVLAIKGNALDFKRFEVLAPAIAVLASLLMLIPNLMGIAKNKIVTPKFIVSIRFIAASISLLAILFVSFILTKEGVDLKSSLSMTNGALFLRFVCPGLAVLNLIAFELKPSIKFWNIFIAFAVIFIYFVAMGLTAFIIFKTKGLEAATSFVPYRFLVYAKEMLAAGEVLNNHIIRSCIVIGGAFLCPIVLWALNLLLHHLFFKNEQKNVQPVFEDEPKVEDVPKVEIPAGVEIVKAEESPIVSPVEEAKAPAKKTAEAKPKTRTRISNKVYHISYSDRKNRTWKVKSEGADKATKIFATQKEAIEYANSLIAKNGGSIRIHSTAGKIRK